MTQGSNALADYKRITGKKLFSKWFPIPYYDAEVRQSYKGGFTNLNEKYKGVDVGEGLVLDVNSLYPDVMKNRPLPFGEGVFFPEQYEPDPKYPLYVQMLRCQFDIKEGYIPTIQLKNNLLFNPVEYIKHSGDKEIVLCLTSPDLKLFLEHYDVYNEEWLGGWKFKASKTMFSDYIDKWYKIKEEATMNKNEPMRTLAKLMLNALYGKFALNPKVRSKIPYLEEGIVKYKPGDPETRKPIYIPAGTFITSWARYKTITTAQKLYDRWIYSDTDSLHIIGLEIPKGIEISDTKLGAWKLENKFTRARFLRAKTYIEEIDGKLHITCAGMPAPCYDGVTWDNFQFGQEFTGKLKPKHVPGGIILVDESFNLKEK